jgi:uncharacterized protein (DUF983 family)
MENGSNGHFDPAIQHALSPADLRDLPRAGWPRLRRLLARGFRRQCPECGAGGIFSNWLTLARSCPRCAYVFEREHGYFLGAYAINLIVAEFLTVGVLVALLVWTALSWLALEAIVIPMAIGLPLLFFPYARTLWMTLDLMLTPRNQR